MKREKAVVKSFGRTDGPVFAVGYGSLGKNSSRSVGSDISRTDHSAQPVFCARPLMPFSFSLFFCQKMRIRKPPVGGLLYKENPALDAGFRERYAFDQKSSKS